MIVMSNVHAKLSPDQYNYNDNSPKDQNRFHGKYHNAEINPFQGKDHYVQYITVPKLRLFCTGETI